MDAPARSGGGSSRVWIITTAVLMRAAQTAEQLLDRVKFRALDTHRFS